jgi:hypothetical protein
MIHCFARSLLQSTVALFLPLMVDTCRQKHGHTTTVHVFQKLLQVAHVQYRVSRPLNSVVLLFKTHRIQSLHISMLLGSYVDEQEESR